MELSLPARQVLRQPSRQFVRSPKWQTALPLPPLPQDLAGRPKPHGTAPSRKAMILAASHERMSMRGLARTFGVSRSTVTAWLKKSEPSAASEPDPDGGPV